MKRLGGLVVATDFRFGRRIKNKDGGMQRAESSTTMMLLTAAAVLFHALAGRRWAKTPHLSTLDSALCAIPSLVWVIVWEASHLYR